MANHHRHSCVLLVFREKEEMMCGGNMARSIFDYLVSFEVGDGERLEARNTEFTIHDVIRKVRAEHPDARMFRVIRKREVFGAVRSENTASL